MEEPTEEPTEEPMEEPTPIGEQMVLPLYVMPVTRPYMPDAEGVAQAVAADLAAIGIQTELVSLGDWTLYLDERRNGRLTGLYFLGWTGDNGDLRIHIVALARQFLTGTSEEIPQEVIGVAIITCIVEEVRSPCK